MKTFISILILLFCFTCPLLAEPLISKSSVVFVANENTYEIPPWGDFYLPAGTLIYNKDKTINIHGKIRELFVTETGLHVYIEKRKYWEKSDIESFKKQGPTVFIKNNYTAIIPLPDAEIKIHFTRGETYRLKEESDDYFKINVNEKNKLQGFGSNVEFSVNIPRKYAKLIYFEDEFNEEKIGYFEAVSVNGVFGVRKGCNTDKVEPYPSLNRETKIGQFFSEVKLDGNSEINELTGFGKNSSVRRTYYKHKGEQGFYKITTIKSCTDTRDISFHISTPYVTDVKINKDWIEKSEENIRTDESSRRILISCPDDYFAYEEELKGDFHNRDIPFIIFRTGKWKNFRNKCPQ